MSNKIDYSAKIDDAMRSMIANVLKDVKKNGLPSGHHFYISFDTRDTAVDLPSWLSDNHPEEMTIVLENWFRDLIVETEGFHITLNFSNSPVALYIPFKALLKFSDPFAQFEISFEKTERKSSGPNANMPKEETEQVSQKSGDVLSLDTFRNTKK